MSIDKDILDRLMEGRSPGDLFGKTGILAELTKALAERALSTEMDVHLDEERAEEAPDGHNQPLNRHTAFGLPQDRDDLRLSASACLHLNRPALPLPQNISTLRTQA